MSSHFAPHNNETVKQLTSLIILTHSHSGGDSLHNVMYIFSPPPTSWDLGSRQYLSEDNSAYECNSNIEAVVPEITAAVYGHLSGDLVFRQPVKANRGDILLPHLPLLMQDHQRGDRDSLSPQPPGISAPASTSVRTELRSCVRVEVNVLGCGFRGRKDLLNRASALVTTCP